MGNQAPLNTAFLGMGRPSFDRGALEADGVPTSVIEALMYLQATLAAMGHAGPSEGDDQRWQNVVARYVDPNWEIYAGRPDTPLTPDLIPGLAGGGEIAVELDNVVINAATTILNFSTAFTVVDAGGGQVDVDVTGGGGGTTYTASTPIVISGGNDISLNIGFGLLNSAGNLIVDIGDGLEADSNKFRVKAHTYVDVTSSGVAVDFTEVSGYMGGNDQYLRNNAGTFQWATLPGGDGVGYDEVQDNGTPLTKRAKLNIIGATVADDAGDSRTNVTIRGGSFYLTLGTITAATWDGTILTLGEGDAELFEATGIGTYETDGLSHTIYNSVEDEILSGKIVQCKIIDGLPVVDVEDCG